MPTPLDKLLDAVRQAQTEGTFKQKKDKKSGITNKPKPVGDVNKELKQFVKTFETERKIKKVKTELGKDTATNIRRIEAESRKIGEQMIAEQQQKLQQYYKIIKEINESEPDFFSFSSADDDERDIERNEKLMLIQHGYRVDEDDAAMIFKLGKWSTSSNSRYTKIFDEGLQFSEAGEISHVDPYLYKNPLKMVIQFLDKIQSTSSTLQKPVYTLQSTRQMDEDISERFKYERDGYGKVTNVDEYDNLIDTDTTPDGKNVMLEMMSDPDPVIGNIRIRDAYPTIQDLIQSQLRNEYFSIPVVSKQTDYRTGEIISGNIEVQINPKLSEAVENYELMLTGAKPMTDDVSELPIYFTVSSVYDADEIIKMTDYAVDLIKTKLSEYGIISDSTIKNLNQQAAAGRHSAILILHRREVYSVGYSTMGGKVEGVSDKLVDIFNKLVGATKGLIATRDYYIDINEEYTNLQISDVGILRRNHLENLISYSRGKDGRGGFGYVSVGGLVEDSPDNMYDEINRIGKDNKYYYASPEEQALIIDEIANDDNVKEYYENGYLTNYGTQFFLPYDAYVFQATESTLISDFVGVFSKEYSNMLSHYGTNCSRFVQSIFNNRITCALGTLAIPSQCKRKEHLVPVDGDYLIQFFNAYMSNNVDGLQKHCQSGPYEPKPKRFFGMGGKKRKTMKKQTKKHRKITKSRKNLARK